MADEVEITNVGGNGVASEVTLLRLVEAMEAMSKAGGGKGGGGAKTQALANKAIAEGTKVTTDNTKATAADTKATNTATDATNKFASMMNNAVMGALGAATKSIGAFASTLLSGNTSIEAYASQVPVIGSLLGPLAGYIDRSVDSFRELSASGASFGNSLIEVRNAAANMEMGLSEFTGFITQNSTTLSILGGTATEGAKQLATMNKTLKATGGFADLKAMGFTVLEINEGMTDYIELQSRMGNLQGRSTRDLAASSADYMKQVDLLAKVTGKTRKEAEAALAAQATDAGIRGMLSALGEGTQEFKNLQLSLAMIDEVGGAAGAAMKDLIDGMPSSAETGQFLSMLGDAGPGIQDALRQIGKGADPSVLQDAMRNAGGALGQFADMDADARKQYIDNLRSTNPAMAEFLDTSTQMIAVGNRDLEAARRESDEREALATTAATFDDTIRRVQAAIQKAFVDSGVLEAFASGLEMVVGFFSSIGETFGAAGVIAALVAGITALFAAKAVTGALASRAGGAIRSRALGALGLGGDSGGSAPRPAAGGGSTGGITGSMGKSIGDFGRGLGKGIGGIFKGLASGIAAFANPAVPIGAAALGVAIAAIGAGIAGATWLMGAALPTFSEGMKSFENLDGDKLKNAGLGMAAVAAGMAAFGVGSAVAGLGGLVGGITEGIGKLFGAEDPMEKVKRFAEYNIDGARVKTNADALVAFSMAMAAGGAGSAAGGIGAAAGAVGSAIAGFFGADSPIDKLVEFSNLDINAANVVANADAMQKMGSAFSQFSMNSNIGSVTIDDDIVEAFEDLSKIGVGLGGTADSLGRIAGITGLQPVLDSLRFDAAGVNQYNTAMEKLVDTLGELNEVLAEDNKGMFGGGSGVAARDALGAVATTASSGSNEGSAQLNTLMSQVLAVLVEMKAIDDKIEKNTKGIASGDLASGYVSNT